VTKKFLVDTSDIIYKHIRNYEPKSRNTQSPRQINYQV
jgi:hypothetical protein